jgi:hypothetical protein
MAKNPRKHYITARYDFDVDATGTGSFPRTVTLANTSTLPDNAIVNEICLFSSTAVAGSSSTFLINAGGVNMTAAIPEANLGTNTVVAADVVDAGGKATSAADIKVVVGTAALTAGVVDITIGYFLGT